MMIYGDTFYRVRPFEIKTLAAYTDQLYIMAYDFSKAKGNPGPNFPLEGKDTFGYDYASLVKNFTQVVQPKKLTVVFGMYGYDWTVDDKNISTGIATAISMNKVEQSIISTCAYVSCTWKRDINAREIKAEYQDTNNMHHIIWYEDLESVSQKKEYLKKYGISSYSFWAYSYF
jgi:spore germination protein